MVDSEHNKNLIVCNDCSMKIERDVSQQGRNRTINRRSRIAKYKNITYTAQTPFDTQTWLTYMTNHWRTEGGSLYEIVLAGNF